jgi:hypothetical protein
MRETNLGQKNIHVSSIFSMVAEVTNNQSIEYESKLT